MPKCSEGLIYKKRYSEEKLQQALEEIAAGNKTLREASRIYSIPRATLQFRRSGRFNKTSLGPQPILLPEEESILVKWIIENCKKGFPRRKIEIQASVKDFLDQKPRPNPFRNNLPEITTRTSEAVTAASATVSEYDIKKWFSEIRSYLVSKGWLDILSDPTRILNGDETNFNLCPKNTKVLAPKGARNVYEIESAPSKSSITVMFTFAASGQLTPRMVIFPYKKYIPEKISKTVPNEWGIGLSDTGWMRAEIFYEYVSNILHPYLVKQNTMFPVILFSDGHSTHLTYKLSNLCSQLKIILICLYPNTTRILQPADVGCFKPIKDGWRRVILEFRRSNPLTTITKEHFAPILKIVLETMKTENIKSAFRSCGLFPFNEDSIDFSRCLGKQLIKDKIDKDQSIEEISALTCEKFKQIVGNDKLKEIEDVSQADLSNKSEEFVALYNLHQALKKQMSQSEIEAQESVNTLMNGGDNSGQNINLNNSELIEESEPSNTGQENWYDIENIPVIIADNRDGEVEIEEEQSCSENIKVVKCSVLPDGLLVKEEHSKENTENISLDSILQWPLTPKRKGTKQTSRMPFVLTSTQWKK